MLVLTRRKGEAIVAVVDGHLLEIMIVESSSGRIRIGLNGPPNCKMVRHELIHPNNPSLRMLDKHTQQAIKKSNPKPSEAGRDLIRVPLETLTGSS